MAKSIRAKCMKRARAEMRATVGEKQLRKTIRKTTRRHLRSIVQASGAGVAEQAVRSMLSGVHGTSAFLVTDQPVQKKKLRYTFNTTLRKNRLDEDLEDETDDEADDEQEDAAEQMQMDAAAEVVDAGVNEAQMKKAPNKPTTKRGMSASYYDWANLDISQPLTSGKFDASFDGRMGLRPKHHKKRGPSTEHNVVGAHRGIFDRLGKEEKTGNK